MPKIANYQRLAAFILISVLLLFTSCKKRKDYTNETAQDAVDVRVGMGALDQIIYDLNVVVSEQFVLRGKPAGDGTPGFSSQTKVCGALVDTTKLTSGEVTLKYTGEVCNGRKCTGTVRAVFQRYPMDKWKDREAIVAITLTGFKIVKMSNGQNWSFDGDIFLTNRNGGTFYDLLYLNLPKLVYDVRGEKLKMTFGTNEYGFLYLQRRLNFTKASGVVQCEVEGLASVNGVEQVECWGENRLAEEFTNKVTDTYNWTSDCGPLAALNGETELQNATKLHVLTCKYAFDKNGTTYTPTTCPYGFKVEWSLRNKTASRLFSFY